MATQPTKIDVYSDGVLTLGEKRYRCELGKSGVTEAKTKKKGDGATPNGEYTIRMVYYRPDTIDGKPKTKLNAKKLTPGDGWSDDANDPDHYNKFVTLPYSGSHENLWRKDRLYNLVIPLGYNDNPAVPGKGSAIFMHVAREALTPTRGCIALAESDLRQLLTQVTPTTTVIIHLGSSPKTTAE